LKLHELEFKLGVEQKLKEGSEKMIEAVTLSNPKDRKSIQEVTVKTMESQEKLSILKRSLQKYKQLYIGEADEEDGKLLFYFILFYFCFFFLFYYLKALQNYFSDKMLDFI
jgi:hypothetical protein